MLNPLLKEPLQHETYPAGYPWGSVADTIDWLNEIIEENPVSNEERKLIENAIKHLEDYQSTINILLGVALFKEDEVDETK